MIVSGAIGRHGMAIMSAREGPSAFFMLMSMVSLQLADHGAEVVKIEDPANPGTWITAACMRPV